MERKKRCNNELLYQFWRNLEKKLRQYKAYYENEDIRGNKYLKENYAISQNIIQK